MKALLVLAALIQVGEAQLGAAEFKPVACEGSCPQHLQGIAADDSALYWSFTTELVKTDLHGKRLKTIKVVTHHGDLCVNAGKLYVAVNLGKFNDPKGKGDSWIYVYQADGFEFVERHPVQEVFHGAGGVEFKDGRFFVVGGLPADLQENYVYEYDATFRFLKKHTIPSGQTHLGIQTVAFANGRWWFGCYGQPAILLVTDADFRMLGRYEYNCSLGIAGLPDGRFLSATGCTDKVNGCTGKIRIAEVDEKAGLRIVAE
ncbi:hypothetical protein Pan44_24850 [Caulifigura coniformis]|uniref:Kelch motif protein n=1 Tax=Caulifigura coniformis TaxID=2527983 RepID=A0A517SEA2_9PLAN|nr:hypothetical protein [Caulifigura coniformis]QDT54452.1 hypothetical protein Pan44_24850 [Caulifigura coniformis]